MTRTTSTLACLFALAACSSPEAMPDAATPTGDSGTDAGTPAADTGVDAFVAPTADTGVDAFVTPTDDAGTDAFVATDAGPAACGTAMPTLPMGYTEGLAIARDGTIYYSRNGGVSRIRPDGTNDDPWLQIGGSTIWGLALDATNTHLFICDSNRNRLRVATNLDTTPTQMALATITQPNGVTVGSDGAVYVSSFSGNSVLRVDATSGAMTTVTASTISGADGVAFTDDGHLLVTSYFDGVVYSLTLDASHHETTRTTVATMVASADGVAVDESGVIWVGGGSNVWRIGTGGTPDMTMPSPGGTANLEWGAGVLGCHDLYVATGSGLRRIPLSVGERSVIWH